MKKEEVTIGGRYAAKVSAKKTIVVIEAVNPFGGWFAINEKTGRRVRLLTARRLTKLHPADENPVDSPA